MQNLNYSEQQQQQTKYRKQTKKKRKKEDEAKIKESNDGNTISSISSFVTVRQLCNCIHGLYLFLSLRNTSQIF